MKSISKTSTAPDWLSKFAGENCDPHKDGYLDELVDSLSEEGLREVLRKILLNEDSSSDAYRILREMGQGKKEKPSLEKRSEDENTPQHKPLI
jgi:hypothetical protein